MEVRSKEGVSRFEKSNHKKKVKHQPKQSPARENMKMVVKYIIPKERA
jgi:hypothetical protein